MIDVSSSTMQLSKGWIKENPETAIKSVTKFCKNAVLLGMTFRYAETEHGVLITAAYVHSVEYA